MTTPAAATAGAGAAASNNNINSPSPLRATNHAASGVSTEACVSNATHCGWICDDGSRAYETHSEARTNMTKYLWDNLMPYDVPRARSLGFPDADVHRQRGNNGREQHKSSAVSRVMIEHTDTDGLSDGVLNQTLHYSLQAKALYPWTDHIPKSIYMEYVVPYAVANEPRSDHRPLLFEALRDMLKDYERSDKKQIQLNVEGQKNPSAEEQIKEAVKIVNTRLWATLGRPSKPIVFQAGLTPRIYDPLSVVAYGYSSCTGLAILLVAALRAVGIPSRMAGTPAWYGDPDKGNHSWVEVYVPDDNGGGRWIFLEPSPGIKEGDEGTADADDLDREPCKRWFCKASRFPASKVYATRFTKDAADTHYPMAWSDPEDDTGVPGEDRSEYYASACGQCH